MEIHHNVCGLPSSCARLATDHTPDLDNLIAVTRSVIDYLWPTTSPRPYIDEQPQNVGIDYTVAKDAPALCYTFSILLLLTPGAVIERQKEGVKELMSIILHILNSDSELVQNATGTTHEQLVWAWSALHHVWSGYCRDAVNWELLVKLHELDDLVEEKLQGHSM